MKCIADQMDLADIKSIIQMTSVVYMFFPRAHRTFSSVDYTLGFKLSLNTLKKL
jgi:anthranilate phosphoribosyltransferase